MKALNLIDTLFSDNSTNTWIRDNLTSNYIWWPSEQYPLTWTGVTTEGYNFKEGRKWQHIFNIAGLCKEWLKIELKEQIISIVYEPPKDHPDKGKDNFIRWSNWCNSLYVDKLVLPQDVKAQYRNGILLISCDAPDRSSPASQIPVTE